MPNHRHITPSGIPKRQPEKHSHSPSCRSTCTTKNTGGRRQIMPNQQSPSETKVQWAPNLVVLNLIMRPRWDIAIIAFAVCAVRKHAIFFGSDLRQYSINLLIVCTLYLLVARPANTLIPKKPNTKFLICLIAVGAISVWLSIHSDCTTPYFDSSSSMV